MKFKCWCEQVQFFSWTSGWLEWPCGWIRLWLVKIIFIFLFLRRAGSVLNIIRNCVVTVLILKSLHQGLKCKGTWIFLFSYSLLRREKKPKQLLSFHCIGDLFLILAVLCDWIFMLLFIFNFVNSDAKNFSEVFIYARNYFRYF